MDINAAIRREMMGDLLREFVRKAAALGAQPEETLAALQDMAATIYAVELAAAESERERQRARRAFIRICNSAIDQLPSARMDAIMDRLLKDRGLG